MAPVEFDLRGLPPDEAPARARVDPAATAASVLIRGPVPALAAVLAVLHKAGRTDVPVSWEPAGDDDSAGLARDLGIGSGSRRALTLVRDDHGGVLLHSGRLEAAEGARRLGLQAYHDGARVADGTVAGLDVRPDWAAVDTIELTVRVPPPRRARRSRGRGVQVASDPARVIRDGVPYSRPVTRWTWYADDRVRWLLQP